MVSIDHDLEHVRRLVLGGLGVHPARVYLFGSRATGQARRTSDIGVAVWPLADLPEGTLSDIREALFESQIPYTVNLVDLRDTDAGGGGGCGTNPRAFSRRPQGARHASGAPTRGGVSDIIRDAATQRFEYTFEATWKAAQTYLAEVEGLDVASPRAAIRSSFQIGVLDETATRRALAMVDDRNLSAYTYNEALAEAVFARLGGHAQVMSAWLGAMEGGVRQIA